MAAVYDRAAGLGDVLVRDVPAPIAAFFAPEQRDDALTRDEYRDGLRAAANDDAWAVWMIIGLAALFAALALVNTAAMAASERREELATIRLLGGTRGHAIRTVVLEMVPTSWSRSGPERSSSRSPCTASRTGSPASRSRCPSRSSRGCRSAPPRSGCSPRW